MELTRADVNRVMSMLHESTADYRAEMPTYTRDLRDAAVVAWVLAWETEDYQTLNYFWQRCMSVVLLGCRMTRALNRPMCKDRGPTVNQFCTLFIEALWEKHTRRYVGLWSTGWRLTNTKLDFGLAYDTMWTILSEVGYNDD